MASEIGFIEKMAVQLGILKDNPPQKSQSVSLPIVSAAPAGKVGRLDRTRSRSLARQARRASLRSDSYDLFQL